MPETSTHCRQVGIVVACPPDVARLFADHDAIDALCTMLEAIADTLPQPSAALCNTAVERLDTLMPGHVAREEAVLFRFVTDPVLRARLVAQHDEDLGLSQELSLALEPLAAGRAADDPEALGYMLRCFFNGCRRSMLVEELAMRSALQPA